jgi:hypothetical protein
MEGLHTAATAGKKLVEHLSVEGENRSHELELA